ncbi:hypothetical protein R6242_18950 [Iodobacter sp. CM08]|uniref:preprotein translocase subunit SecA n=1 Tax=Iodobacter sp. CM08 TaxID=3085902 RepID=UPI002980C15A|nr:hypothetical protein [Iodobacter sp. CM08]MDW5418648.1 hypothetical protein [Iodobacter sp. CM08]
MSDIRALIVGKNIKVSDGVYLERAEVETSEWEERLRSGLARLIIPSKRKTAQFIQLVASHESRFQALNDPELKQALYQQVWPMLKRGFTDQLLAPAFAVIREASRRCLGMRHHDVQLLAGRALLGGKIAEMATGEGKTLAGTLAICTAAATGAGVHVVTVNDYLAIRDAEQNKPLFDFFGLTLGIIKQDMQPADRRQQYACHITYVSNKELTFDYLKDRIAIGGIIEAQDKLNRLKNHHATSPAILRGLHVAIIDEADSVLIDEARTPLIISETLPDDLDTEVYHQAIAMVNTLIAEKDYQIGKKRDIWLTPAGQAQVAKVAQTLGGIWKMALWQKELSQKALSAIHLFKCNQHYIIAENKVQIVDESTGRVMPDRTWERGLHQMIEAKENCEITGQRKTLSQITYQRFFGRYLLLGGMTGTAKEIEPELKRVYDLSVVKIPTHKPSQRSRLIDHVFTQNEARWQGVVERAIAIAGQGRSVLIGSRSVEASEILGELLKQKGINHTVLNARNDAAEADAVAQAGQVGQITVATNMAGRGTDIKLHKTVATNGGLHVILTEFHESARVDRQLFGRSARQGDPGTVEAFVCLQDELFCSYAPLLSKIYRQMLHKNMHQAKLFRLLVKHAQSSSEKYQRNIRLNTIRQDRKWLKALGFVAKDKK